VGGHGWVGQSVSQSGREGGREGVSDANSAISATRQFSSYIFVYHGEYNLILNDMMMRSVLY
jgi:hypothetical protein